MRCAIVCALFGVVVSTQVAFAQVRGLPRPGPRVQPAPVRPPVVTWPTWPLTPPLVGAPWFGVPFWFTTPAPYPYPSWTLSQWPAYVYVGGTSSNHPQLVFNDGTTYSVSDYWRVDDVLHFITIEEGGTKSVEHTVPFNDLNIQRTTDADTARGFRFVLRDEPIEQWLRDQR